jgi:uncharacterized protein (TIGR02117 family)
MILRGLLLWLTLAGIADAQPLTIYLERERQHTALVLPVAALLEEAPAMAALLDHGEDTRWLRFGWGEAGYFGRDDRTSSATLIALFWRSPSVIEVARLNGQRSDYSESYPLDISAEQFSRMVRFISDTFDPLNDTTTPLRQATRTIHYYQAAPRYHLFYTCNHWTAQALHQAGLARGYRRAWLAGSVINLLVAAQIQSD